MTDYQFPLEIGDGELATNERQLLSHVQDGPWMERVRYIIIHCSATRPDTDYTPERLLRDHKARGFRTVGYHFYIRRDGSITQHRLLLEVGAHCRPWNRCSIGICYEGGLDSDGRPADTRTPAQRIVLRALVARLHGLFPNAQVRGHRDMPGTTPKACPSFDVRAEWG